MDVLMLERLCRRCGCQQFELIKELSNHLNWPIITTPEGKGVVSILLHKRLELLSTKRSIN